MVIDPAASLHRAAALLDESARLSAEAVRPKLFGLFDRGGGEQVMRRAMTSAERAVRELEQGGGRGKQAADGVRELVDEFWRRMSLRTFADVRREYPLDQAPERFAILRDRMELLAGASTLDDAAARAEFGRRLDVLTTRVLAQPKDQPTRAAIAALAGMPDTVRPALMRDRFARSTWEVAGAERNGGHSMTADDMLVDLKAGMDRRALATAPGATPETMRARLDELLARPTTGPDELRELSLLDGLPDELRPTVLDTPPPFPSHALVDVAGDRFAEYGQRLTRANVEAVRVAGEVEAMARAGTLPTREAAIAEIAGILDLPSEAITDAQLRRLSLLARLPEQVRPPLPPRSTRFALEDVGLAEWPTLDREIDVTRTLDDARTFFHVLRSPEEAARTLRASWDAGEMTDLRRLAALQHYPQLLDDAGITTEMLGDQLARQLGRAGDADVRGASLTWALRETREGLDARLLDAEFEPLRARAIELADRNLARIDGLRSDTFGRHPDYAEVGQLASIAQLLAQVEKRAVPAAGAAESLAW